MQLQSKKLISVRFHPIGGSANKNKFVHSGICQQKFMRNRRIIKAQNSNEKESNRVDEISYQDYMAYQMLNIMDSQNQLKDMINEKFQALNQSQFQKEQDTFLKNLQEIQSKYLYKVDLDKKQISQDLRNEFQEELGQRDKIIQDLHSELQVQKVNIEDCKATQQEQLKQRDQKIQDLNNKLQVQQVNIESYEVTQKEQLKQRDQKIQDLNNELKVQKANIEAYKKWKRLQDQRRQSKYSLDDLHEVKLVNVSGDASAANLTITFDVLARDFSSLSITVPRDDFGTELQSKIRNKDYDSTRIIASLDALNLMNCKIVKAVMNQQDLKVNRIELELQTSEGNFQIFRAKSAYILLLVSWWDGKPIYITKSSAEKLCKK